MSTELMEVQLAELQRLLAVTSCQLLRAKLEQCQEHVNGLVAPRRLVTSTSGEESDEIPAPIPPVKRSPSKSSQLQKNIDSADYETLQYSWEQSSKFVKLYLTVAGLTADDNDKVTCSYSDQGFDLRIQNVDGKNYKLVEDNLTHKIKSKDSKYRLKDGCLVMFLWKATPKQRWAEVSSKPGLAFLDHYGRSKLKTFLYEYLLIKASDVHQAENNPLQSSIRKLMTSQGYYDVTDVASAKAALARFKRSPPKAVLVSLSLLNAKRRHSGLLTYLASGIAAHPCVAMVTCPGFIRPDEQETDSKTLDVLLNGRCALTHFSGRLSVADVGRLPATLYKLGVGVAGAEDAAALAQMTLPENLQTFGVSVSRGVKVEDLGALPAIKNPYQLFFSDVTDDDVEWVIGCLNKMVQKRVCWLHLPNSALSPTGLILLRDRLFNEDWSVRHKQEQFIMQITAQAPFNPFAFLKPPPPKPTAPLLGLPPNMLAPFVPNVAPLMGLSPEMLVPFLPNAVVNGVLGVAVDVTNWKEDARAHVLELYRSYGCQLKWTVDWNWNDAQ